MAIIESLVDDLDGTIITEGGTVPFAINGQRYEIDLSDEHQKALQESFAEWVSHARKVNGKPKASKKPAKTLVVGPTTKAIPTTGTDPSRKEYLSRVRAWARANDYPVSDKGRIPQATTAAFELAN